MLSLDKIMRYSNMYHIIVPNIKVEEMSGKSSFSLNYFPGRKFGIYTCVKGDL